MKLLSPGTSAAAAEYDSRQLVSDLFHQLSQPLTTLCCSLELALLQTPSADQYGEIVSQALNEAEKVSTLVTAIRELLEAGQAPEAGEMLDLRRAVEDAVGDLLPVAESAGVQVCYLPGPGCPVWFDALRLRQALFHLIGFVIASAGASAGDSGGPGNLVTLALVEQDAEVVLTLATSGKAFRDRAASANSDLDLLRRLGLAIARAIFEAAGGSLTVEPGTDGQSVEVRLPRRAGRSS